MKVFSSLPSLPLSSLQEPAPPSLDQPTSPDQSSGITLTELNEKEVAQPQQDSKPESPAGVVKRRISRTEKEKVQCNGCYWFLDYVCMTVKLLFPL